MDEKWYTTEKWQNNKNIDFFLMWNIAGIFQKNGKTAKISIFMNMELY